jgi:hypothetical protein
VSPLQQTGVTDPFLVYSLRTVRWLVLVIASLRNLPSADPLAPHEVERLQRGEAFQLGREVDLIFEVR